MPKPGSIPSDVVEVLRRRRGGATMAEIGDAVRDLRGDVPQSSVRKAVYAHLDDAGERLFRRDRSAGRRRGRYFVR